MPVINGVYLKDFPALPSSVVDANIIPIAESGNQIAYRTTVGGIVTDARVTGKVLTGLSVTGGAIASTDTILQAFGKVQNQLNNRVTSVGLSMPSAFTVTNSPVTGSGTLTVTGAGLATQYIRGDGQLADFPTGGGGGSSVSYYLNGSVSQGTFSGNTYYEMNKNAILGAGTDFTISADGYIASFITDANDPDVLLIPGGNWNLEFYFSASSGGGTPSFYVELSKWNGSSFTAIASNSATPELIAFGTSIQPYFATLAVPETVMTATDRLAIRVYVTHSGRTITLHTENNTLCQIITTFTTGLQSLNGLTKQAQFFSVGTSGTDFNISSSVATHTFNIPSASATNRGLVTTGTQTFAGDKTFTGNINATPTTGNAIQANTTTSVAIQTSSTSGNGVEATATTGSAIKGSTSGTLGIGVHGNASGTGGIGGEFIGSSNAGYAVYAQASGSTTIGVYATANSSTAPVLRSIQSGAGNIALFDNSGGTVATITNGGGFTMAGVLTQTVGTSESKLTTTAGSGLEIRSDGSTSADRNIAFKLGTTVQGQIYNSGNWFIGSSPTDAGYKLDVNGTGRFSGQLSLGSTITNGTYTYTLPGATGTLALTSNINTAVSGTTNYIPKFTSANVIGNSVIYETASNILINTTDNSGYRLDVNGTGRFTGNLRADSFIPTLSDVPANGLFLPATNAIGFSTNTTERMRITSGGNVGIGTNSPSSKLHVYDSASGSTITRLTFSSGDGGDIRVGKQDGVNNDAIFGTWSNNSTLFYSNSAERMRITSGGNVGINTTSPKLNTNNGTFLTILGNSASSWLELATDSTTDGLGGIISFNNTNIVGTDKRNAQISCGRDGANNSAYLAFATWNAGTGSERMRITSGGDVLIGTTTTDANTAGCQLRSIGLGIFVRSGGSCLQLNRLSNDGTIASFRTSDTERGSISISGSTTSYNTSSDYRLKEDFKEINGIDKISLIKVYNYKWKDSENRMDGVLAHELSEVVPYAVYGKKDEIDEDGKAKMQGVDYSKLVPLLVKAIQELNARIIKLESK